VSLCGIHNWYYGGVLVPFSSNAGHQLLYKVTPLDYLRAAHETLRFDFKGAHTARIGNLMTGWLSGPRELLVMMPLHACAFLLMFRVGTSPVFDPRLRLMAWATIAGHAVAFLYVSTPRYYYVIWLLNLIVAAAWLQQEGLPLLVRRIPAIAEKFRRNRMTQLTSRFLTGVERGAGMR
jgi:hypothetical protein